MIVIKKKTETGWWQGEQVKDDIGFFEEGEGNLSNVMIMSLKIMVNIQVLLES